MKRILFTTVTILLCCSAFAQSNKEEIDMMQSAFGMEKKAITAEFITLEGAAKDAFWSAYDEYEIKRKELGKKRIDLLNKYISNYESMDDASMDAIVNEMIGLQGQTDKLIATYYKKIKKDAGIRPAAQFFYLEGYILSKIRTEIMEGIPEIGKLSNN